MKVKKSELEQLIQEGIWDSLKYYVGKMGFLKRRQAYRQERLC